MRTMLRCLIVGIAVLTTASAQWREAATRSFSDFSDIYMVSATKGWGVGSSGTIYKTTDAGQTWTAQTSGSTQSLSTVWFIDENKGFIGTTNRTLLVTTNGGSTWTSTVLSAINEPTSSIKSIRFFNSTTGLILSGKTDTVRIVKTTDGGSTWTSVWLYKFASGEDALNLAVNGTNAVLVGKPFSFIYTSTDAGATWTKATTPSPLVDPAAGITYSRSDLWAVTMPTPSMAIASGWGSSAAGLQPTIYLKSSDGGKTWAYMLQQSENRTYKNCYGMYFKDSLNGYSVGASFISKTTNGGTDWLPQTSLTVGSTLNGVHGVGSAFVTAGSDGYVLATSNFGSTTSATTQVLGSTVYAFQFTSATTAYAGGFGGVLLKTTNGGQSWRGSYIGAAGVVYTIQEFYFLNDNLGYAAGSYRSVFKTTDGGQTWTPVFKDTTAATYTNYGLWFSDQNNGWVVGSSRVGTTSTDGIYKTTDGGVTWTAQSNIATKQLRDVHFSSAKGVAVGDALKIIYSTNGGTSWTAATIGTLPSNVPSTTNLRRVSFVTGDNVIAVGGKAILRSTDAGATWTLADTASTDLYDVKFNSAGTIGYAVGASYCLKTTNGGTTWTNVLDTTVTHKSTLYSCAIDPAGNVWVGSTNSTMYTNAPLTSVQDASPEQPLSFRLEQNYPNPFNPGTAISYQLSSVSNVVLKVFDVLGREIVTLTEGERAAGVHRIQWDASGVASGVYLYRLEARSAGGTNVQSKRMVLLK